MPEPSSPVLAALEAQDEPVSCKAGVWLDGLTEEERAGVVSSVVTRSINRTHTALLTGGISPCSASVWHRHWTGACRCPAVTTY